MGYLRDRLRTQRGRRIALGLVVVLGIWMVTRCSSHDTITPPALVFLPKGDTDTILSALQDQGIDLTQTDLEISGAARTIPSGWVRFNPHLELKRKAFVQYLYRAKREPTRRVVMYSGDTIQLFAQKLASQTLLSEGKLLNAYYRPSPYSDGGILAGHYAVPYRTDPDATMYALTYHSRARFQALAKTYGLTYDPKTFKPYLIIASIIQKETWRADEMPRIASVITNRLKRGMKLQLDATLNYGPYAHTPVTPERIRTDASRFNTYRHTGLPPEPIGSISESALRAALHPAKTPYLFFVRNIMGAHDFASDYATHRANITRIKFEKARLRRSTHSTHSHI